MSFDPDSNLDFDDFDSLATRQARSRLLEKTAGIGDWYYSTESGQAFWSEYLYDFYELNKEFDCSRLLDNTDLYGEKEKEKLRALLGQVLETRINGSGEFMIVMDDGRHKWHTLAIYPVPDRLGGLRGVYGILRNITMEKQLRVRERNKFSFHAYVLDHLPAELIVLDRQGRRVYANQEAIGNMKWRGGGGFRNRHRRSDLEEWSPATRAKKNKVMRECMECGQSITYRETFSGVDGGRRVFARILYPLCDEQGQTGFLAGYGTDISALETANSLNMKLQRTIENAMEGIALLDGEYRYSYVNNAHAVMFGYESGEEMIGAKWQVVYMESEIAKIQGEILPLLMRQGFWRGELCGKKRDGTQVFQDVALTVLPGSGIACICRDITERKRSEWELKRLAIVAEKTNSIVVIADREKRVKWVNRSFENILGYRAGDVVGRDPVELLKAPGKNAHFISEMMQTLDSSGVFSGELLACAQHRARVWLYVDITAIHNSANQPIGYIAVMNDITLIKKAEIRLQKSMQKERMLNRLKTQFISLASHQFRTPLATLRSSVDVLDMKLDEKNPEAFVALFQRYKHVFVREIGRMTELMENILDTGRLEEGKIQISKHRVSLRAFMQEFVESSQEPGPDGRSLVYHYQAPDDEIEMDPVLLRNVLRNIVSNAYKYSLGCRPPELTVVLRDGKYRISIRDYGIGIPEKERPLLLQSFFRASNAKHIPGCGLGLMIAKRLIEAHGGEIEIKSRVEVGCQVTIILPC